MTQEESTPAFVSIPDMRAIQAGETVCVRVVVPGRKYQASMWYTPMPNMPWDSVMLDLAGQTTGVSIPVDLKMVRDMRNTERSSTHIYEADVMLRDADSYVPTGWIEFRDAQWNPQNGLPLVDYNPEPLAISPQLKVAVVDLGGKYSLDNYLKLPLCTEPNSEGRWIHQADLPFNQTLVPAAENHGLVWLPYDCRLRPISYQEFAQCAQTQYPRMHWFGDSNTRRMMKKIVSLGEWCGKPEEQTTKQCLCEDHGQPFGNFHTLQPDTIIDLDPESGGQMYAVHTMPSADFSNVPHNKSRIYMHRWAGLTNQNRPPWHEALVALNVSQKFGHPEMALVALSNWENAYSSNSQFAMQMDLLLDLVDEQYSQNTELYLRTGQYYCCRTDPSPINTRHASRLRGFYFDDYIVDSFRHRFGSSHKIQVWDVAMLGERLPLEVRKESFTCPSNHARAEMIDIENQVLFNAMCNQPEQASTASAPTLASDLNKTRL
ncbi:hypothetical protein GGF46_004519 [Coemansia sp. RSA 552]|nr:hypothetical protein GGF46_004519 [Coemansia sp. RSA 552]